MDPRCFSLYAAYGSPLDQRVDYFRWFRDRVLLSFEAGKQFVEFYYENSPLLATYISQSSFLRGVLQIILYPVLGALMFFSWCDSCGIFFYASLLIFVVALFGLYCLRRYYATGIFR